jgi:hypothetical protein
MTAGDANELGRRPMPSARKKWKVAGIIAIGMIAAALLFLAFFILPGVPGGLGPWHQTTSYPLFPQSASCAASGGYVYCVGGYNGTTPANGQGDMNLTYYASLSPAGVGPWIRTTDYPIGIQDQSCVASSGYIYCVGGYAGSPNGRNIADVYYAPLSSSGIGSWARTTSYPYPVAPRCVTDSGYAYCEAAAYNGTAYLGSAAVYFAQLSASGVGNWQASAQPPSATAAFSVSGGYAYAYGGGDCPPPALGGCSSPSYFAALSANGTSVWIRTKDLPTAAWATYLSADSYAYYFADSIYFARLSASGMGTWLSTTPYPDGYPASCVASGSYLYCVGGWNEGVNQNVNNAYFTRIGP